MIGDTVYDVEGANALNIPCIGVSWGYGVIEDMKAAGAIGIADSTEQLYRLIEQF
jgi:phosphoglycolate phosphatase